MPAPLFSQCAQQTRPDSSVYVSRALPGHITAALAMELAMSSLVTHVDASTLCQLMATTASQIPPE